MNVCFTNSLSSCGKNTTHTGLAAAREKTGKYIDMLVNS